MTIIQNDCHSSRVPKYRPLFFFSPISSHFVSGTSDQNAVDPAPISNRLCRRTYLALVDDIEAPHIRKFEIKIKLDPHYYVHGRVKEEQKKKKGLF